MSDPLQPLDRYRTKLISNADIHVGADAMKKVLDQAYEQQKGKVFWPTKRLILDLGEAAMH